MNNKQQVIDNLDYLYNTNISTEKYDLQFTNNIDDIDINYYDLSSKNNFYNDIINCTTKLNNIGNAVYNESNTVYNEINTVYNEINTVYNENNTVYNENNTVYNEIDSEKYLIIDINKMINKKKILNNIYNYTCGDISKKKNLLLKYNKATIFSKVKDNNKNKNDLSNIRFLINHTNELKIIDKLYVNKIIKLCNIEKFIDPDIFKASICGGFNDSCILTAYNNTKTKDNVVLLDIKKAFDSVEWNVLEYLLLKFFCRIFSVANAKQLTEEYLVILKNRNFYYKKIKVTVNKGISQGFPSSNFIFTIIFSEIIYEFTIIYNYNKDKYFKLNIFVDDVWFYIINKYKSNEIINNFINILSKYKLIINKDKSLADSKLNITYLNIIEYSTLYLGIPFTRNIEFNRSFLLEKYKKKHGNTKLDEITWKNIIDKYINGNNHIKSHIRGWLLYHLKPLIFHENNNINIKCTNTVIINFINKHFIVKNNKYNNTIKLLILLLILFLNL